MNGSPNGRTAIMNRMHQMAAAALMLVAPALLWAQTPAGKPVALTADNFIRAESDLYFGNVVKDHGFGKFTHNRELTPLDKQLEVSRPRSPAPAGSGSQGAPTRKDGRGPCRR
jgi:hypothetical protein